MSIETSVIIRTKNEEKWLGVVLDMLFKQTYKNFEVILVDSGSRDRTLEIGRKFPVKIFEIPQEKFSYPYALNYGIEKSEAEKFVVIISGHSIPISDTWLECGIKNFTKYDKLMGVYGFTRAMPGAGLCDKFFDFIWSLPRFAWHVFGREAKFVVLKNRMGVMGFTNAIVRKDLWEKRNFNEDYGQGGEDKDWADYWFRRGCIAVLDEKFTVRHSHNLGLAGWYRQFKHWKSISNPQPFKPLFFRRDPAHKS
jgi:glycosyltransferase involved in cell wall biosynthesis